MPKIILLATIIRSIYNLRMEFSDFGKKLTANSGILLLMDDLGKPLKEGLKPYPLGGGNPARVPEIEAMYRKEMLKILETDAFERNIGAYDSPQGRMSFIDSIVEHFNSTHGWGIERENVAITNGSQSAMFYLFNLFSGSYGKEKKTILFPLMPEYIGYADQGIEPNTFVSIPSICTYYGDRTFKYSLDLERVREYLESHREVGAICVSRPTNPSGNVLRTDEISALSELAKSHSIPLLVDNAYGLPFPNIIFTEDSEPIWNESIILSMSLSKIGLPSIRTGIVIARKEVAEAISNINAIAALASGSMGQALTEDLIKDGRLTDIAKSHVKPFYKKKAEMTENWIKEAFSGTEYFYHRIEGSIFCWLYLPRLSIPSKQFYAVLKDKGVITVPGEYFFFGHEDQRNGLPYPHDHYDKCLRINYSGDDDIVSEGIRIIAETYKEHYC